MEFDFNLMGLEWCKSLKSLEYFGNEQITNFIKGLGSQRLLKEGYNLFVCSYVKEVWTSTKNDSVFVKAKCYPRMRKHEEPRQVFCEINQSTLEIVRGSCSCKAGLGKCIHLVALLQLLNHLAMMDHHTIPEDLTCTSMEQQWHKPRGQQIEPSLLAESIFAKPQFQRKGNPLMYSFSDSHVDHPTDLEIEKFRNNLKKVNKSVPLAFVTTDSTVGAKDTVHGKFQHGTTLCHQLAPAKQVPTEEEELPIQLPLEIIQGNSVPIDERYRITIDDCFVLEQSTRGQAHNSAWIEARKIRLTASTFGKICKRRLIGDAFLKEIYEGKDLSHLTSIRYGNKHEPDVKPLFIEKMTEKYGGDFHVFPVGLIVNPGAPFMGCSPDGVVLTCDKTYELLEIKCPISKRNMTLKAALKTPKFYLYKEVENETQENEEDIRPRKRPRKRPLISTQKNEEEDTQKNEEEDTQKNEEEKEEDGEVDNLRLKKNCNYYYQVQGQMLLTGINVCNFVVYNGKTVWITKVKKDDAFCRKMLATLTDFFKNYYQNYVRMQLETHQKPTILFL